ncbi:hypothetical protein BEWA_021400 [Theileria equi strain WA]|uniref:Uncharacterized protein n=1 Tax=Theileria equi strain WA TaxID=1537102 RepID=L0AUI3_THEEQ|nr:hypothetical protein BEWA_021400 [Theileria equi strain WA]AFZ79292.1 hypothetical protein BEWA_021400 [Theileria equi strain WA]|eukprot:XP_004828958.1 hypothetical protein BEWA_021400 [Theileria equi strain WA]
MANSGVFVDIRDGRTHDPDGKCIHCPSVKVRKEVLSECPKYWVFKFEGTGDGKICEVKYGGEKIRLKNEKGEGDPFTATDIDAVAYYYDPLFNFDCISRPLLLSLRKGGQCVWCKTTGNGVDWTRFDGPCTDKFPDDFKDVLDKLASSACSGHTYGLDCVNKDSENADSTTEGDCSSGSDFEGSLCEESGQCPECLGEPGEHKKNEFRRMCPMHLKPDDGESDSSDGPHSRGRRSVSASGDLSSSEELVDPEKNKFKMMCARPLSPDGGSSGSSRSRRRRGADNSGEEHGEGDGENEGEEDGDENEDVSNPGESNDGGPEGDEDDEPEAPVEAQPKVALPTESPEEDLAGSSDKESESDEMGDPPKENEQEARVEETGSEGVTSEDDGLESNKGETPKGDEEQKASESASNTEEVVQEQPESEQTDDKVEESTEHSPSLGDNDDDSGTEEPVEVTLPPAESNEPEPSPRDHENEQDDEDEDDDTSEESESEDSESEKDQEESEDDEKSDESEEEDEGDDDDGDDEDGDEEKEGRSKRTKRSLEDNGETESYGDNTPAGEESLALEDGDNSTDETDLHPDQDEETGKEDPGVDDVEQDEEEEEKQAGSTDSEEPGVVASGDEDSDDTPSEETEQLALEDGGHSTDGTESNADDPLTENNEDSQTVESDGSEAKLGSHDEGSEEEGEDDEDDDQEEEESVYEESLENDTGEKRSVRARRSLGDGESGLTEPPQSISDESISGGATGDTTEDLEEGPNGEKEGDGKGFKKYLTAKNVAAATAATGAAGITGKVLAQAGLTLLAAL